MEPKTRVQFLDGRTSLEIVEPNGTKKVFNQEDLLRNKAYFESMIEKGQSGLQAVNELLAQM